MARRTTPKKGKPVALLLALSGIAVLLLGLGLGTLLSSDSCRRRPAPQSARAKKEKASEPRKEIRAKTEAAEEPEPAPTKPEASPEPKPEPAPAAKPNPAPNAKPSPEPKPAPKPEPRPTLTPAPKPSPKPTPTPKPPRQEPQRQTPQAALPRLAVVIDDLGYAPLDLVKRLCALNEPLTVAVLPHQEFTRQSAELAHARGKEVILHLPMEPQGYPGPSKDPGPGAVFYDLKESEIRDRVRKALASVPFSRGANNHMGSRITPDRTRMTWVLEELRANKGYFLDSRTEKDSVAYDVAERLGIRSVQRKVFLDDSKAFPEMEKQWARALGIAKTEGQAVIIGHIYPETVAALEQLIPKSRGQVSFVFAGSLAK